jgi:hypothetical protein
MGNWRSSAKKKAQNMVGVNFRIARTTFGNKSLEEEVSEECIKYLPKKQIGQWPLRKCKN